MEHLKGIIPNRIEALAGMIDIRPGRVVSMALSKNEHCLMTLLAFADGESVSEEEYFGDTLYYILEGEMPIIIDDKRQIIHTGECIAVPAGVLHAVGGAEPFKLLQITLQ